MPLIAEFDQLVVVRLLDVIGAHALEYVTEQIELAIGVSQCRLGTCDGRDRARLSGEQRHRCARRRAE